MTAPRELPLRICKDSERHGAYSIKLAGVELSSVLLSDGFSIRFKPMGEWGGPDRPEVTMIFAAGALDLDLDADLTDYLRTLDTQDVTK